MYMCVCCACRCRAIAEMRPTRGVDGAGLPSLPGAFLVHPRRYDKLLAEGATEADLAARQLARDAAEIGAEIKDRAEIWPRCIPSQDVQPAVA